MQGAASIVAASICARGLISFVRDAILFQELLVDIELLEGRYFLRRLIGNVNFQFHLGASEVRLFC